MDEAEKFRPDESPELRARVMAAARSLLQRYLDSGDSDDPFSYVGAPVKPKTPSLEASVRLPLP